MISLTEKYCPQKLSDFIGQKTAITKIVTFLNSFSKSKKRGIILYGPTGTGKSCAVYTTAKDMGYDIIELNADSLRNKESVERVVGTASKTGSIFGRKKLILVDEVETFSRKDSGGMPTMIKLLKESSVPIVFIALDLWDRKISSLKYYCESAEFKKIFTDTIKKYLESILKNEKIEFEPEVTEFISKNSNGDLRAALNDLNLIITGKKEITKRDLSYLEERPRESKIFSTVQKIFKANSAKEAREAFDQSDVDIDTLKLWLTENITNEFSDSEEIAGAYNYVSRSDVFSGRIRRQQSWSLYKYVIDLLVAGMPVSRKTPIRSFTRYNPPGKLMKFYRTKSKRNFIKSISLKIAHETHTSSSEARKSYFPMLKAISRSSKKSRDEVAQTFNLAKEEAEFLSQ